MGACKAHYQMRNCLSSLGDGDMGAVNAEERGSLKPPFGTLGNGGEDFTGCLEG